MNDITSYFRDYNYAHFDFTKESLEKLHWHEHAPALGATVEDFELPVIDGNEWRLSDCLGAPVVIEFGSFTCPIFCGRIEAMEDLAASFPDATFVIIYVREAHPGEVTPSHDGMEDKIAAATRLQSSEQIQREILLDHVDGSIHRRFGANYNGVFVLDAQARVVLRRRWNEPSDVRRALSAFADGRYPVPSDALSFGTPCDRLPPGEEILNRGGVQALVDFASNAPTGIARMLEASSTRVRQYLEIGLHSS